jgi:hypothetical protein
MNNKPILYVMLLFSLFGLWQFSDGIRSVDVVGLFASGMLLGVAATRFLAMRNNS